MNARRLMMAMAALTIGTLAVAVKADDRVDSRPAAVTYRYVGQGSVLIPATVTQREAPYALTGRAVDDWSVRGHWMDLGQSKVFIPATR
jgi:hypothetical protein